MDKWTFYPAATGGSIAFPSQEIFNDYISMIYPGAVVHGTSVNDGTTEFGKVHRG